MPSNMNMSYNDSFASEPAKVAGQDISAYIDLSSFDSSSTIAVTTANAPASTLAFSNAFNDALLDSPLGLSPQSLNASPFDFSYDAFSSSPMINTPYLDTPELESSTASIEDVYPSLFGKMSTVIPQANGSPQWEPQDVFVEPAMLPPAAPQLAPKMTMSPSLMSLEAELAALPALASSPSSPIVSVATPESNNNVDAQAKKGKFNGTRNTKKPMIDFDAPTLPKNYLPVPSKTTKKRAPPALTKKAATGPSNKRVCRDATPLVEVARVPEDEASSSVDLSQEVLVAIEDKRRSNTLAARRSRIRKVEYLKELTDKIDSQAQLIAELQAENARLRASMA